MSMFIENRWEFQSGRSFLETPTKSACRRQPAGTPWPAGGSRLEHQSAPREPRGGRCSNILIDPHRAFRHTSALWMECCDFRSLHFTYLPDVCLFDDDLPIANLEPGVSGRNSLPLSALRARCPSGLRAFWRLSTFVLNLT